ncbi:MAG: tetratricopeptide repeat protein [Polyangiales bacterium]
MTQLWRRPWVVLVVLLGGLTLVVFARTLVESHAEVTLGDEYASQGETMRAVEHYRRAVRWAAPLNPYSRRAATALRSLAIALEEEGRLEEALLAWRSLLGSDNASGTPLSSPSGFRSEALERISALSPTPEASIEPSFDRIAPDPVWGTALVLGFAAWLAGLAFTALRGFDASGVFAWHLARSPLAVAAAGFGVFVLGMLLA